MNQRGSRTKSP